MPLLERAGFTLKVLLPEKREGRGLLRLIHGIIDMSACLSASRDADILFIQKRLLPKGFLTKIQKLQKRIVFDYDDSIFTSPKGDWSPTTRFRVLSRLKATLTSAHLVIAGNEFLKSYAMTSGAARVETLPTPLDVMRYPTKNVTEKQPPTLGWIGSSVNYPYLDLLSSVMPRLKAKFPGLRLLIVSDKHYSLTDITVENRRWSEGTEVEDLHDMDVGLMPLADNDWTRGKCALKALQYMACGIPAVCSPVGANLEVVDHGQEGFLPKSEQEWVECLGRLLACSELRRHMGIEGRKKVLRSYSLQGLAPKMIDLLESL